MKAFLEIEFASGEGACAKEIKEAKYCAKREGKEGSCPCL